MFKHKVKIYIYIVGRYEAQSMGKCIWIINQYASHLETRHLELAKVFAHNGYSVVVITSSFHHGKREYMFSQPVKFIQRGENIDYIYLRSLPKYRSNGVKRVLNMLDFCRRFQLEQDHIASEIGYPDFIIASSAHPFVWELGYSCARRFKAKFIAEFRDIWPLSLVQVQGVSPSHPLVKLFSVIEKRAYRRADAIVSTMPYAWKHVCAVSGVDCGKIHWMPNGLNIKEIDHWDTEDTALPEDLSKYLVEHWCCVYEGSIAKCEHIDFLLDSFKYVKEPNIALAIVGDGGEKEALQAYADRLGLTNLRFFPEVSKPQVREVLLHAGCCVATVHNLPVYEYGISMNKLSDYLYSGKPTIFACGVDNMVKDARHYTLPYDQPELMARTIEEVYRLPKDKLEDLSLRGRQLIREQYDFDVIGQKYLDMMEGL